MKLIVLGLPVLLFCLTLSAFDDQSEHQRLSDSHQMFPLRDALTKHPHLSDFCAGEVACAFNDTATCENKFKNLLAVTLQSTDP